MSNLVLYESAAGYALFEKTEYEEVADQLPQVQASIAEMNKFGKLVKLRSFIPFSSAENALENMNDISEGVMNEYLKNFLEANFPKSKSGKKSKYVLGVSEDKIGSAIQEALGIKCEKNAVVAELIRGIRYHFESFVKEFKHGDVERSQLGLAHSYSRAKVKFNIHRADNNIIQSINLLDQLDKDLNTFAMRNREWYSWHFPELVRVVNDNYKFAQLTKFIKSKDSLTEESVAGLEEIVGDRDVAEKIVEVAASSMGQDISDFDMINVEAFADRVIELFKYRAQLHQYLQDKMQVVAPNLSTLVGDQVGARLISHAGSLTSLAKYPASTVQILGAEKALFRALKTKGNTPKYGLIFHSSFIGRAATKNKGRISRYLANKCSIAARIDTFSDTATTTYGAMLKDQVEERLSFYDSGATPRKNVDVMHDAFTQVQSDQAAAAEAAAGKKKSKKKKSKAAEVEPEATEEAVEDEQPKKKKKKSSKAAE